MTHVNLGTLTRLDCEGLFAAIVSAANIKLAARYKLSRVQLLAQRCLAFALTNACC